MKVSAEIQGNAGLQWHRIRLIENPLIRIGLVLLALAYVFLTVTFGLEIEWTRVANGLPRAVRMITRMVPPDFGRWELLTRGLAGKCPNGAGRQLPGYGPGSAAGHLRCRQSCS